MYNPHYVGFLLLFHSVLGDTKSRGLVRRLADLTLSPTKSSYGIVYTSNGTLFSFMAVIPYMETNSERRRHNVLKGHFCVPRQTE